MQSKNHLIHLGELVTGKTALKSKIKIGINIFEICLSGRVRAPKPERQVIFLPQQKSLRFYLFYIIVLYSFLFLFSINMFSSSEKTAFQPPSMVCISIIITQLHVTIQLEVLHVPIACFTMSMVSYLCNIVSDRIYSFQFPELPDTVPDEIILQN